MWGLFKTKWGIGLLALIALVAVLTILLAPGYDLAPSAGRAARAAALTMLSMVMAARLIFASVLSQHSHPSSEPPSFFDTDLCFSLRC
jgi:hypothetical protein